LKFEIRCWLLVTGILPRKPRLLGGDEEAGIKKIKINYRDAPRFARGASLVFLTLGILDTLGTFSNHYNSRTLLS